MEGESFLIYDNKFGLNFLKKKKNKKNKRKNWVVSDGVFENVEK